MYLKNFMIPSHHLPVQHPISNCSVILFSENPRGRDSKNRDSLFEKKYDGAIWETISRHRPTEYADLKHPHASDAAHFIYVLYTTEIKHFY